MTCTVFVIANRVSDEAIRSPPLGGGGWIASGFTPPNDEVGKIPQIFDFIVIRLLHTIFLNPARIVLQFLHIYHRDKPLVQLDNLDCEIAL